MRAVKFKLVRLSPMRIPPQQEAAAKLVAQMRKPFPIATYLNELIKRNQPGAKHDDASEPHSPAPVDALEALVE